MYYNYDTHWDILIGICVLGLVIGLCFGVRGLTRLDLPKVPNTITIHEDVLEDITYAKESFCMPVLKIKWKNSIGIYDNAFYYGGNVQRNIKYRLIENIERREYFLIPIKLEKENSDK